MKSIYSSKLYKASKRKDRIKAAMLAPGNVSLVQQLAEDLDEEYKVPENFGIEPEEKEESSTENNDLIVDEDIDLENDLVTIDDLGGAAKGSGPSKSGRGSSPKSSSPKGEDKEPKEDDAAKDAIPDSPMTEEPAEASTTTKGSTSITAASIADLNILKGTLNSREDTSGVTRVAEKENEIWIYYNDDVNLNNIMTEVIEFLLTSGYEQYEFNRLARSDNAIVFVTLKATEEEPKQIEDTIE
jgi:hypothetical protein